MNEQENNNNYIINFLGFAQNLLIEIFIHFTSLILPVTLVLKGFATANIFLSILAVFIALYCYPITILLLSAIIMRFLPKPNLGYVDTLSNYLKYITLTALNVLVRRSPARGLLMLPMRNLYYQLAGVKLGNNAIIGCPDCLHDLYLVSIGKNTVLGFGSLVLGHCLYTPYKLFLGKVEIGDDVMIGSRTIIWPNVKIGDRTIVQNGSVVLPGTIIPNDEVWGGIPARRLKIYTPDDTTLIPFTKNAQEIQTDILQYLCEQTNFQGIPTDLSLISLGMEATDISRLLVKFERKYNTFIDRTQVNLSTYSLDDLVDALIPSLNQTEQDK